MQKDNIKNANLYYAESGDLPNRIKLGLEYLKNKDFSCVEPGKYEILGNEVYASVQNYLSKPKAEGKFEAHRKYVDIQYIIEGEEQIGVADVENDCFSEHAPYDENKDIVFFTDNGTSEHSFIFLKAREFAILEPKDAHMPSIAMNNPAFVKKVVVKVLL